MMQSNPIQTFLQEADDLLAEIESAALSMDGSNRESVNQVFRAFHTIKGSGAMFGFDEVAAFTHHVESLLDQVRDGRVPVTAELSSLILAAADHIGLLLQASQGGAAVDAAAQAELSEKVRAFSVETAACVEKTAAPAAGPSAESAHKTWRIRFRPSPEMLMHGGNPALLIRDLKKLGECVVEGHCDALPPLAEMQVERCYFWWTMTLTTTAGVDSIRDVFLFVEDGSELNIEAAAPAGEPAAAIPAASAAPARKSAKEAAGRESAVKESTVRVPSARLDRLVNLVGELVMNQSRLATAASRFQAPELAGPVEEIERLVAELRDDVLQIRMMPIGTIFGRFRRLVRDLSLQLGKEIELVTEGEETELDKSILDQLGEPLVHLLRNSIDHGIEPAAARAQAGKPRCATIQLCAQHTGSDVVVSIQDDGAGIDRAAVRAKAVERHLIAADANLSDKEILNLILLPGFSTAKQITSVSGRGVGMDAVKRQIDALRGTLLIASEEEKGTRVSLSLPLTLAIIEGLLVEIGRDQYIVPMSAVMENVELLAAQRVRNNGRNLIEVRGELIPYIDLRGAFGIPGHAPPIEKIVIVRRESHRVGLVVDCVLGTHQTVIQSLGKSFRNIEVVSGSTVMGDGRVALILDIAGVVRLANRDCRNADAAA